MWDWYEWDSVEEFNAWHDSLCASLGYPLDSYNQATGEIDLEATKTTAYTSPSFVQDKVIATVEVQYAEVLTLTALRLPTEPQR